jgi:two-component system heavy metal sensor histidine kinase CusS
MRSLRGTLVLGTSLGVVAVIAAIGGLFYLLLRGSLVEQFDRSLHEQARLLASTVEVEGGELDTGFDELDMQDFEKGESPSYLQLWGEDGPVLYRSPSLGEADLQRLPGGARAEGFHRLPLPGGGTGRAVEFRFTPRLDEEEAAWLEREGAGPARGAEPRRRAVVLVLAHHWEPMAARLSEILWRILLAGLVTAAASLAVLGVIIRRTLRPLGHLAANISRLDEHDLSARVDDRLAPRELRPVAERLNELLRRLEAAFQRERSLTADVAHELRTPLTGLRSTLDVALSRPRPPEEYQARLEECRKITVQMQGLIESLLAYTRMEAGLIQPNPEPVLLDRAVRDCWKPLAETAAERRLKVHWALDAGEPLVTDPALFALVLQNVLGNAVTYADSGGTIRVETILRDGLACLSVRNSGSQVPEEQSEAVFERFWRGDPSRSANGSHSGLGLSLVKRAVTLLGGTVEVASRAGGEFRIAISLPHPAALPSAGDTP